MTGIEDPNELRRRAVPWHDQVQMNVPVSRSLSLVQGTVREDATSRAECTPSGGFNAMRTVAGSSRLIERTVTKEEKAFGRLLRRLRDFSPNYEGDISNERNKSANIPDDLNTSIWLTSLPAGCTTSMLLGAMGRVGGLGKIWSSVINKADPEQGKPFAAAKVVFFSRAGAERFMAAIQEGRLRVGGRRPRATWNRIKSAPEREDTTRSRVVIIQGPAELVNRKSLDTWFSEKFVYQTEAVLEVESNPRQGTQTLEWRFGSYRCQAEAAVIAMKKELSDVVTWKNG